MDDLNSGFSTANLNYWFLLNQKWVLDFVHIESRKMWHGYDFLWWSESSMHYRGCTSVLRSQAAILGSAQHLVIFCTHYSQSFLTWLCIILFDCRKNGFVQSRLVNSSGPKDDFIGNENTQTTSAQTAVNSSLIETVSWCYCRCLCLTDRISCYTVHGFAKWTNCHLGLWNFCAGENNFTEPHWITV